MKKPATPTKIQMAESRMTELGAAIRQAEAHVDELRAAWGQLSVDLSNLRAEADKALQRAVIARRGGNEEVVIVRRTATTIYTRRAGDHPDADQAWRQTDFQRKNHPEQWNVFPKDRGYSHRDARTLIVAVGEKAEAGDESSTPP